MLCWDGAWHYWDVLLSLVEELISSSSSRIMLRMSVVIWNHSGRAKYLSWSLTLIVSGWFFILKVGKIINPKTFVDLKKNVKVFVFMATSRAICLSGHWHYSVIFFNSCTKWNQVGRRYLVWILIKEPVVSCFSSVLPSNSL